MYNGHSFYHGAMYTLYDPCVLHLNVLITIINHHQISWWFSINVFRMSINSHLQWIKQVYFL